MPTYEYRCKDCGHEFEAVQSFTDDALSECPTCSGALKKKFGTVGIAFKGSGFYKTDSRSSASKAGASSEKSDTSSTSSSSSDTKSDAKSDTKSSSTSDSSSAPSTGSGSTSGGSKEKASA